MIGLVLLFASLFHHHKPADIVRDGDCAKQGKIWLYLGDDMMIGISEVSCVDAKHNWAVTHVDPVKMSQISGIRK